MNLKGNSKQQSGTNNKSTTTKSALNIDNTSNNISTTSTSTSVEPTSNELKEKGNLCVHNANYENALEYYTKAIKLNPVDSALYSNRSLVFLKLKQYYYASQDADMVIQLNSTWAKGHYRKAEVLTAVGHYDSALLHYGRALQLQQGDRSIIIAAQKAAKLGNQQTEYERRLPWVGAGVGIIIGVIIALCDTLLTEKPTLKHPTLMAFFIFVISIIGYIIARTIRYYQRLNKKSLLEPPLNLNENYQIFYDKTMHTTSNKDNIENNDGNSNNGEQIINRNRYSKTQARLRFKKGKS